jgi:glycosyltransferase involved in cell wall biosynthesis
VELVPGTLIRRMMLPGNSDIQVSRPVASSRRQPSVSIVIPCYNYGHYLQECVASVLSQPDVLVDVLLIDDASPDGSAEVVRRIAAQDGRVRAICHQANQGHIATYNEGLAQVSGDYTVLLSADDLLTPGCLARATSLMEEYPSVGLTYGFPIPFSEGSPPPARTVPTKWIVWHGEDWLAYRCKMGGNALLSPEGVLRTSVLRDVGGFRADLPNSGDFEWWMRVATASDVGYVAGADQAYYRIHSTNMHHSQDLLADLSERLRCFDAIFATRAEFLRNANSLRDLAHRQLAREALAYAISSYARGVADDEPIDAYAAFASDTWPEAKRLREWHTLDRMRRARRRRSNREPSLMTRRGLRELRYRALWWRRRWVGV